MIVAPEESDLSQKQIISFFRSVPSGLKKSVGLMGGWAVTYLLKNRKIKHIGSRDIDIFYDSASVDYKNMTELIEHQGFQRHSTFRWVKFYDRHNEKQISEQQSRTLEPYDLVTIYLDLAAPDEVNPHVMHEPLLREVFANKCEIWKSDGDIILMPDVVLMVKIKIKSAPQRVDDFKRQKDLVDLLAMVRNIQSIWLTKDGVNIRLIDELRDSHLESLKKELPRFRRDGTIKVVADNLSLDSNVVIDILERL